MKDGATNDNDDIEVYFEMPEEPGAYDVPLFVTSNSHPYVNMTLNKLTANVTVVEANQ